MTRLIGITGDVFKHGTTTFEKRWDFLDGVIPPGLTISYPTAAGATPGTATVDASRGYPSLKLTTGNGVSDVVRVSTPAALALDTTKLKRIWLSIEALSLDTGGTPADDKLSAILRILGTTPNGLRLIHRNYDFAEISHHGSSPAYERINYRMYGLNGGQRLSSVVRTVTLDWDIVRNRAYVLHDGEEWAEVDVTGVTHGIVQPGFDLQNQTAVTKGARIGAVTVGFDAL